MGYLAAKYSTVKNRLLDWLRVGNEGNVKNLTLDLCNRAQRTLWEDLDCEGLVKIAALEVIDCVALVPADFGRLLMVFSSNSGADQVGVLYGNQHPEIAYRFTVEDLFDPSTGHSFRIRFAVEPAGTMYLKYQVDLTDIVETDSDGNAIEVFLFFPEELLFRQAQVCHAEEKDSDPNEVMILRQSLAAQVEKYKRQQKRGKSGFYPMKDAFGNAAGMPGYNCGSGETAGSVVNRFPKDYR